eukprot:COSAG02_NODE_4786_length_4977_cov_6.788233_5_plen_282_part_00
MLRSSSRTSAAGTSSVCEACSTQLLGEGIASLSTRSGSSARHIARYCSSAWSSRCVALKVLSVLVNPPPTLIATPSLPLGCTTAFTSAPDHAPIALEASTRLSPDVSPFARRSVSIAAPSVSAHGPNRAAAWCSPGTACQCLCRRRQSASPSLADDSRCPLLITTLCRGLASEDAGELRVGAMQMSMGDRPSSGRHVSGHPVAGCKHYAVHASVARCGYGGCCTPLAGTTRAQSHAVSRPPRGRAERPRGRRAGCQCHAGRSAAAPAYCTSATLLLQGGQG